MTQEDKNILLKDICARIPYGLFCQTDDGKGRLISVECSFGDDLVYVDFGYLEAKEYDLNEGDSVKPYLRPMPSMTAEEKQSYYKLMDNLHFASGSFYSPDIKDWLDERFFDYRGLIHMGLALEAPEGMYKTN